MSHACRLEHGARFLRSCRITGATGGGFTNDDEKGDEKVGVMPPLPESLWQSKVAGWKIP